MKREEILELVAIACEVCGVPELTSRIRVQWNTRFTARMGDARWDALRGQGLIRLSVPLWPRASEEDRRETIVHEACHIIADYRFGRRQGHGHHWRQMMALCGYRDAKRCHDVDRESIRERRGQNRLRAACGCAGGVIVGPVQVRRIQAGAAYTCRRCDQRVRLG